ncbi:KATNB1-like protein 1 [Scleropages formosus]|uniref:Katanin p80 subunit B-like 1 n=1 Tax=Scleropages formosus TaxID=113540 RepID=A0A8C9S043_SCLFO|nr:KATNB1-like protein 1 [Scleropages formosus]
MASGDGGDKTKEPFHQDACPRDPVAEQTALSASGKTMKEVDFFKKEEINKKRSPVGRTTHNSGKVKRVVSSKRKAHQVTVCPGGRRRPPAAGRSCDMANKENEVACAEDLYGDRCRHPLNPSDATKMEGSGSKYSDYFTELSKDHDVMSQVLFGRNLRLNVALTLWRRNAGELVAYLIRIQDTGVLVDCLPVITKSLQEEKPSISIGCCVDLLPLVKILLASQYEEYLIVGLQWLQSVLRKWWPELSVNGKSAHDSHCDDKNIKAMKQQLQELWEQGSKLILVPGTTGEIAKAVESYLSQLR